MGVHREGTAAFLCIGKPQNYCKQECLFLKGQATDILIHAEEILKMKKQINKIYAYHTGKPVEEIGKLKFV